MSEQVKVSARDLIRRSLTLIGALGQGENPRDDEAQDALSTLNEIVDKWNVEALMIIANKSVSFPLTGKKSYTIGVGGDINVSRPPSGVLGAYYDMPNVGNGPLSLPMTLITEGQYESIMLKNFASTIPDSLYYSPSYPLGEIFINPICSTGSIVLTVADQFKSFATLDDVIDLPSGYVKALRYNLAVELSFEYGRPVDERMEQMAVGAKAFIKSTNGAQRQRIMSVDSSLLHRGGHGYNIYTGE